jgi:hypothetical protein
VTLFPDPARDGSGGSTAAAAAAAECYCKLYRNRHVQLLQQQATLEFPSLEAYTAPAEWVRVYHGEELFLEECAQEPQIERHKTGGWKYHVVQQVSVRKGPSFASQSVGMLDPGESVAVNERVAPPGSDRDDSGSATLLWLRLKDDQGWVHNTSPDTGEAVLVPQSLRQHNDKSKRVVGKKADVPYNTVIARLFHNHDDGAPGHQSSSLGRGGDPPQHPR